MTVSATHLGRDVALRHVAAHQHGLAAGPLDVGRDLPGLLGIGVEVERDLGAVLAEGPRRGGADAGRAAGDEDGLALEVRDEGGGGRGERGVHLRNSGEIRRGRNSAISGQTMIAASTSSIGTSMIIVSLSAYRNRTLATAQEIIRQRP